jgi:hypothetical protein
MFASISNRYSKFLVKTTIKKGINLFLFCLSFVNVIGVSTDGLALLASTKASEETTTLLTGSGRQHVKCALTSSSSSSSGGKGGGVSDDKRKFSG